jgi:hypothetical protein
MAKKKAAKKSAPKKKVFKKALKSPKAVAPAAPAPPATRTVPETFTVFAVPDQFSDHDKQMLQALFHLFDSSGAVYNNANVKFVSYKNLQQSTLDDLTKNQIPLVGTC